MAPIWEGDHRRIRDLVTGAFGSIEGSAAQVTVPKDLGIALYTDGATNRYVQWTAPALPAFPYTMMAVGQSLTTGNNGAILDLADNTVGTRNAVLLQDVSAGHAGISYRNGGWAPIAGTRTLITDRAHVLVGIFRNLSRELWVDGYYEIGETVTKNYFTPNTLKIGELGDSTPGNPFAGWTSIAAVWNRELSVAEILQLAHDPFCMVRPARALYLPYVAPEEAGEAGLLEAEAEAAEAFGPVVEAAGTVTVAASGAATFAGAIEEGVAVQAGAAAGVTVSGAIEAAAGVQAGAEAGEAVGARVEAEGSLGAGATAEEAFEQSSSDTMRRTLAAQADAGATWAPAAATATATSAGARAAATLAPAVATASAVPAAGAEAGDAWGVVVTVAEGLAVAAAAGEDFVVGGGAALVLAGAGAGASFGAAVAVQQALALGARAGLTAALSGVEAAAVLSGAVAARGTFAIAAVYVPTHEVYLLYPQAWRGLLDREEWRLMMPPQPWRSEPE